jgi:hypothetical protein
MADEPDDIERAIGRAAMRRDRRYRLVAQLAGQLKHHLPIRSHQHLDEALKAQGHLMFGETSVDVSKAARIMPANLLPIETLEVLVTALTAMTFYLPGAAKLGIGANEPAFTHFAERIADAIAPPAVAVFSGPSIFHAVDRKGA